MSLTARICPWKLQVVLVSSRTRGISVFSASILSESQPLGCGAISSIFRCVGSHFYFVTHSQNSPLKTSGRVVVVKDKWDHCFQRDQKHISGITTSWVWGIFCHISRGWKPFLFCHSQPEFAPKNFMSCCCYQGQVGALFSAWSKAY